MDKDKDIIILDLKYQLESSRDLLRKLLVQLNTLTGDTVGYDRKTHFDFAEAGFKLGSLIPHISCEIRELSEKIKVIEYSQTQDKGELS